MKNLIDFDSIIVHPGRSHFDERMAVSLALAAGQCIVPVYRREPTAEEIEDPSVLVLDVGGVHDPSRNDFDHHQLPRGTVECSFSLVAKELGIEPQLREFFPWFTAWRMIDSCGPFQWAKEFGLDWSVASSLLNTEGDLVAEWWEEANGRVPVDGALVRRLKAQGEKVLATAQKFKDFCQMADQWDHPEFDGVKVMDFTWASPGDALDFGDAYARSRGITGGVLVSRDNRGPGLALFRREDDPRVDFSVLEGNEAVTFAHKGGFIAKTVEGAEWAPLVRAAIKKA